MPTMAPPPCQVRHGAGTLAMLALAVKLKLVCVLDEVAVSDMWKSPLWLRSMSPMCLCSRFLLIGATMRGGACTTRVGTRDEAAREALPIRNRRMEVQDLSRREDLQHGECDGPERANIVGNKHTVPHQCAVCDRREKEARTTYIHAWPVHESVGNPSVQGQTQTATTPDVHGLLTFYYDEAELKGEGHGKLEQGSRMPQQRSCAKSQASCLRLKRSVRACALQGAPLRL